MTWSVGTLNFNTQVPLSLQKTEGESKGKTAAVPVDLLTQARRRLRATEVVSSRTST